MNCSRCGGVMNYERFYGAHEHFCGCRCISCGEIVDEVILENRRAFGKPQGLIAYEQETRETAEDNAF